MTTGRINQVNGGTNKILGPAIWFYAYARLRSVHTARRNEREDRRWCTTCIMRVASLFPPWSEGQCLAPSTDGRGPSRADSAPRRARLQILPRALGRKAGDHRTRQSVRPKGSRTHHRHSVTGGRGAGDRTVPWGVAREELGTGVGSPGLSHPSKRATGP